MEKVPKLQVIEENVLDKYEPPMPDWNCLYWEGVSDEEYEELRTMKKPVMIDYEAFGRKYPIQLKVTSYLNNGNLAIQMYDWIEGYPEPWAMLTVNLWDVCEKTVPMWIPIIMGKRFLIGSKQIILEELPGEKDAADIASIRRYISMKKGCVNWIRTDTKNTKNNSVRPQHNQLENKPEQ